jgi:hypothetical protein
MAGLWSTSGCDNTSSVERKVRPDELPAAGMTDDGEGWQSAPFPAAKDCGGSGGEWIKLKGKDKSEGLVIPHPLGRVPSMILSYLSFHADGCGSTLGAGDMLVIDYVDDREIKVHNNTEEYYYLRLMLR